MIFAVQRFLEDHLLQRNLADPDQYAVHLANLYGKRRWSGSRVAFEKAMRRVHTLFFKRNHIADRASFELQLLGILDKKFPKKKPNNDPVDQFPGGVAAERRAVRKSRATPRLILQQFKRAIEGRAVDSFWNSRKAGKLARNPETIGQALLGVFLQGVLHGRSGLAVREMASGVGWVDVLLLLSTTPHLMELKILKGKKPPGVSQLGKYMTQESRDNGWLVLFDVRAPAARATIPQTIALAQGTVRIVVVDVNPIPPSKLKN